MMGKEERGLSTYGNRLLSVLKTLIYAVGELTFAIFAVLLVLVRFHGRTPSNTITFSPINSFVSPGASPKWIAPAESANLTSLVNSVNMFSCVLGSI